MANIKSQKKRIITSRKANAANRSNRAALKTNIKKANAAVVATTDAAEKEAVVAKTFSEIDKAVRKGVLKRNTANHRKAAIAKLAVPDASIVCITGDQLKPALEGYFQVLYDADPASVGGTLPGDDFYYKR